MIDLHLTLVNEDCEDNDEILGYIEDNISKINKFFKINFHVINDPGNSEYPRLAVPTPERAKPIKVIARGINSIIEYLDNICERLESLRIERSLNGYISPLTEGDDADSMTRRIRSAAQLAAVSGNTELYYESLMDKDIGADEFADDNENRPISSATEVARDEKFSARISKYISKQKDVGNSHLQNKINEHIPKSSAGKSSVKTDSTRAPKIQEAQKRRGADNGRIAEREAPMGVNSQFREDEEQTRVSVTEGMSTAPQVATRQPGAVHKKNKGMDAKAILNSLKRDSAGAKNARRQLNENESMEDNILAMANAANGGR